MPVPVKMESNKENSKQEESGKGDNAGDQSSRDH